MNKFLEKLNSIQASTNSYVCVGLDPDFDKLPEHLKKLPPFEAILQFNIEIINATKSVACAYKPNLAFYEALGTDGFILLQETMRHIPPSHITIADAKRGDIGNTATMYAKTFFEIFDFDAITVSPYMGRDAVLPFLSYKDKCTFVLALTSNKGAGDLQKLKVGQHPLFVELTILALEWEKSQVGTLGLVVGGTQPDEMERIRTIAPTTPFLIPGIGAQGGDANSIIRIGLGNKGTVLINSSRGILYASSGIDFASEAFHATETLRQTLNQGR